ncbi:MAG: Rpn family recombination-promoting nuclease/putative transposase [Acutalibacter sp.]|nr:Rpn family recombination-promoting nuclease/putative transposase [Acutalibacter sp.]
MNRAIEDLSIANDFIFGEIMRQPENVKPLLEAVLEKKIAEITYIEKQQDIKDGFELHGIRLDISLEDDQKTQYAVEMQTGSACDLERRIRYYQSSLDRRTLEVSERYRDLKDSYVIFVCTDDYYKRGLALYKRKSVIEGAEDIVYEDGSHAYILNANFTVSNMGEPALEFLRYINAKYRKLPIDISGSGYLTQIDRAVEDIKADDRKVERFMTLAAKLEDVRFVALREGEEKGRAEGEHNAKVGLVKRLLARTKSLEEIADICDLDLDEVKKIAEESE